MAAELAAHVADSVRLSVDGVWDAVKLEFVSETKLNTYVYGAVPPVGVTVKVVEAEPEVVVVWLWLYEAGAMTAVTGEGS